MDLCRTNDLLGISTLKEMIAIPLVIPVNLNAFVHATERHRSRISMFTIFGLVQMAKLFAIAASPGKWTYKSPYLGYRKKREKPRLCTIFPKLTAIVYNSSICTMQKQ